MNPKKRNPTGPLQETGKSEFSQALESLTRLLALRDHSKFELQTKLSRRFPAETVEKVLAEAESNGWLADETQIAERLALALVSRHKSQMYIEGELRKRRLPVPPRDAEAETEQIRHLVERKFGTSPLSYEDKAKAYRFLKYRGFQDRAIRQVLNEER